MKVARMASCPEAASAQLRSARCRRQACVAQRGGIFLRLIGLAFVIVLLGVLYLARRPVLRMAGGFWIVDEAPQASDAIVILGDDNYLAERAARAAELYHAGWAPRVIASGRYLRPNASIAELMEHDLKARGVPAAAIVRFAHRGDNTREEALAISGLIETRGWKRILVVTSNYHTRRARYICRRAFPRGSLLRMVAAADSGYNPESWWETRTGLASFFHESVGIIVAMWELRHSDSSGRGSAVTIRLRSNSAKGVGRVATGVARGYCKLGDGLHFPQFTARLVCTIVRSRFPAP